MLLEDDLICPCCDERMETPEDILWLANLVRGDWGDRLTDYLTKMPQAEPAETPETPGKNAPGNPTDADRKK